MQASRLFIAVFATSLLVGCPKLKAAADDAAADAGTTTATTPEPSATTATTVVDAGKAAAACKAGQVTVKVKNDKGAVESRCGQICGPGVNCPTGQGCSGTTTTPGQYICANLKPDCKPGEKLVQGSAATLFDCLTPCKADADCPKAQPICAPDQVAAVDNPAIKFRVCREPLPATGGKTMPAPAATVDRMPRNRLKDGECPAGFTEQPGVEEHSECARNCKTEAECHGHTCVDSDVGSGKICSREASKPSTPTKPAVTCKAGETEIEGGKCAKSCVADKDCAPKKCMSTSFQHPSAGLVNVKVCQ